MSYRIAVLGLQVLVLVHEAGHFFTARAVGLRPTRFYVGFPPPLVRTRRGGTEYGIGSIPLGGLVSIPGMTRPAPGDLDLPFGPALREAPGLVGPLERLKADLAAGGGRATTTIGEIVPNSPAQHAGLHAGDRIASIDGRAVKAADIPKTIRASHGRAITLTYERGNRIRTLV